MVEKSNLDLIESFQIWFGSIYYGVKHLFRLFDFQFVLFLLFLDLSHLVESFDFLIHGSLNRVMRENMKGELFFHTFLEFDFTASYFL